MIELLPKELLAVLQDGEGVVTEFKEAKSALPKNLFETVCAMLNRFGGHIFLGVKDLSDIIGVNPTKIKTIRKDFANLCNNPEKIFPTVLLDIKEYSINNKTSLYIYVPESSDVYRTASRFFDRNEDGDFDVTNNTKLISEIFLRKQSTYAESRIYPHVKISDLRKDLIDKARRLAVSHNPNHPWRKFTDKQLLESVCVYEKDLMTGEVGVNLAGILMFGSDSLIHSAIPHYKTDAIFMLKDSERYEDRNDIRTNLIESYEQLFSFVLKHTDNRFRMENGQRISARDIIARELCTNMLIHREFSNPYPSRLIISEECIIAENANKPRMSGFINLLNYVPYPKNPKIAHIFKEMGLAEELGSGLKNIVSNTRLYSNALPSFKEGDTFTASIPLKITERAQNIVPEVEKQILSYIQICKGVITRTGINDYILSKYSIVPNINTIISNALTNLRRKGLIINRGTRTKPNWQPNEQQDT